jgi:hypothetical protein
MPANTRLEFLRVRASKRFRVAQPLRLRKSRHKRRYASFKPLAVARAPNNYGVIGKYAGA